MESTVYYQDPQVVIRSMLPGDIQQLANGFAAQGWHKSPEQFAHYLQLRQEGSRKIIIAEHRGQAVGYTTLLPGLWRALWPENSPRYRTSTS